MELIIVSLNIIWNQLIPNDEMMLQINLAGENEKEKYKN